MRQDDAPRLRDRIATGVEAAIGKAPAPGNSSGMGEAHHQKVQLIDRVGSSLTVLIRMRQPFMTAIASAPMVSRNLSQALGRMRSSMATALKPFCLRLQAACEWWRLVGG
jgi:hypothetical protein